MKKELDKVQRFVPEKVLEFSAEDMKLIQQIARDSLMEPFTGHKSLETIQKTRSEMEKGLGKLKNAGSKAGKWISDTRIARRSQTEATQLLHNIKSKTASNRLNEFFEKMNRKAGEIQNIAKKGASGFEEKTRQLTLTLIDKGLELMLQDETPDWIIERARIILDQPDITKIEQIRQLSVADRQQLIDVLYPYNSKSFQKYIKGFDLTVNIGMGAVVATNIPGTGIAMSVVNMGKTLVKIGNRLSIMSAAYGRQISGKTALFKTSARIISSLEDWESNDQHQPLNPDIVAELYALNVEDDDDAFGSLLNSVARKDAYIAIPGVGMISLGKINLDDLKMDLVIQHLVQNHHEKSRLAVVYGRHTLEKALLVFSSIYQGFLQSGYFDRIKELDQVSEKNYENSGWFSRLKALAGEDQSLDRINEALDQQAYRIFSDVRNLEDPERSKKIDQAVRAVSDRSPGQE